MQVRRFAPCDLPGLYRVCLLTGADGRDASTLYRDPDLLGHLYAGAYPHADPTLTWVVRDELGVAGYLVATDDSAGFARWQEDHWWPNLRVRYPLSAADPLSAAGPRGVADPLSAAEAHALQMIHDGQPPPSAEVAERFPAHLHIDLLPRLQGAGLGRRLIAALVEELRSRGVPGVHLGVAERNAGAIAFYDRVGFGTHSRQDWGRLLTMDLTA